MDISDGGDSPSKGAIAVMGEWPGCLFIYKVRYCDKASYFFNNNNVLNVGYSTI